MPDPKLDRAWFIIGWLFGSLFSAVLTFIAFFARGCQ